MLYYLLKFSNFSLSNKLESMLVGLEILSESLKLEASLVFY